MNICNGASLAHEGHCLPPWYQASESGHHQPLWLVATGWLENLDVEACPLIAGVKVSWEARVRQGTDCAQQVLPQELGRPSAQPSLNCGDDRGSIRRTNEEVFPRVGRKLKHTSSHSPYTLVLLGPAKLNVLRMSSFGLKTFVR